MKTALSFFSFPLAACARWILMLSILCATLSAASLDVSPSFGLSVSNLNGGTVQPPVTYTLTNNTASPLNWTAAGTQNWVTVSPASGTLAAGTTATVTMSINANVNSLAPLGPATPDWHSYSDTVTFTNTTDGSGNTTRSVALSKGYTLGAFPTRDVTPAEPVAFSGSVGGPFVATANSTYWVSNNGTARFNWVPLAVPYQSWLLARSDSYGWINGGQTSTVQLSVSSIANLFVPGNYSGSLNFMEMMGSNFASFNSRSVSLTVAPAPPYPAAATLAAKAVTSTSAVLNGLVNPDGSSTSVSFDYGTTIFYGANVAGTPTPITGGMAVPVSTTLTGLSPGTTYHFRVAGVNSQGTGVGGDMAFTTILTNANLSNLALSTGTLSPVFASGTTSYSATVSDTTTSISLTPTAEDSSATITINGTSVASGSASAPLSLAVGNNTFTVVVTAPNGTTQRTYTASVFRPGSNVDLSNLTLSAGALSPAFSGATTGYTASVPNATASITVAPTVAAGTATVKVNGVAVASGSASGAIALSVGANTITTLVTAQDGTTTKTYTVTVTRAPGSNADLSNLALSAGTLNPAFASGTTSYTMSVPSGNTSITVTPTASDASNALLFVNGLSVSSGSASGAISLAAGANTITTTVIAEDGVTAKTYTVTVTRAPSTNADLSYLSVSGSTLSPAFTSATTGYTASVPYATTSITVTPGVSFSRATVKVNGVAVTSGTASGAITLNVGASTITTVATAEDGTTTKTYTVTVTRDIPSSNADLSNLVLSKGTLSPVFASGTTGYTTTVPNAITSISVKPTVSFSSATVKVNGVTVTSGTMSGVIALNVGANTITTVVTAEDGTTTQSYTVAVTRDGLSVSPAIGLASSGVVGGPFMPSGTSYTLTNSGTLPLNWTAAGTQSWLTASPASGTLGAGGTATVTVAINSGANSLVSGNYSDSVTFTNATNGIFNTSQGVVLRVRYQDYFTELFDANGTNDVSNQSFLFTPNGSASFYGMQRTPATAFFTDPAGGAALTMDNDTSAQVTPAGGQTVKLHGTTYTTFYVGSNGYITFNYADGVASESFYAHFAQPRISALFDDLNPSTGQVTWKQTADRVAVTWQAVPEFGTTNSNSFQIEMFFDGRIRITCLGIAATDGLIGLSRGFGVPADFVESDFSLYPTTGAPASTTLAATGIGATGATLNGTVNANVISTSTSFDYGTTVSYGTNVAGTPATATGSAATAVSAAITGLSPGTTYHFRAKGVNSVGTGTGSDLTFTTINNNANLSALALSAGTLNPVFASATTSYTASVTNATTSITVTPTVSQANATVKVNGVTVASGTASGAIALNVGANTILTVVTALDGTTTKTYAVTVTRAASSNADLSNLVLSAGTLNPVYASATTSYTASVANATTSITVTPTVAQANATVKVNGVTVASGTASGAITLGVGANTISTVVTAQDGTTTKTYAVTVTRAAPSANANLSNLALSAGVLSPAFAGGTTAYTAAEGVVVTSLTVTPTLADTTAAVTVNGAGVVSGTASVPITIIPGTTSITVAVTAQDGATVKTYTVTVKRAPSRDEWRMTHFGTTSGTGDAADDADPDLDGLPNLVERAFGTNPLDSTAGRQKLQFSGIFAGGGVIAAFGQPIIMAEYGPGGVDCRALFIRLKDYAGAGLACAPQFCASLVAPWQDSAAAPTVLADDGIWQIVSVPYPTNASGNCTGFFRVTVTAAP